MIRRLLLLLPVLLPAAPKRSYYRRVLGWDVGPGVRIGLSYLDARAATFGPAARVGHFNVFRGLAELRVGRGSYLANFNQVSAARHDPNLPSRLVIGDHVNLMSHHFLDVAGVVTIGDGATVGGRDSHVWSHTVAVGDDGRQSLQPRDVTVGPGAYLGARVTLVGCAVPADAFVGAGSVVTKRFPADPDGRRLLIAGNPAAVRKTYPSPPPA